MTNYYNENATSFFNDTVNVDMSSLYSKFTPLVKAHGSILDAGCGSARDSLYFKTKGFNVHSFDASEVLAEKASQLLQQNVESFIDIRRKRTSCKSIEVFDRTGVVDATQKSRLHEVDYTTGVSLREV